MYGYILKQCIYLVLDNPYYYPQFNYSSSQKYTSFSILRVYDRKRQHSGLVVTYTTVFSHLVCNCTRSTLNAGLLIKYCNVLIRLNSNYLNYTLACPHVCLCSNVFFVSSSGFIFTCDICFRSYNRKDTLARHKKMECDQEPMFPCSFCLYKAKRKHHLQKHMLAKHSEHMESD